jgi:hypothetical protein
MLIEDLVKGRKRNLTNEINPAFKSQIKLSLPPILYVPGINLILNNLTTKAITNIKTIPKTK